MGVAVYCTRQVLPLLLVARRVSRWSPTPQRWPLWCAAWPWLCPAPQRRTSASAAQPASQPTHASLACSRHRLSVRWVERGGEGQGREHGARKTVQTQVAGRLQALAPPGLLLPSSSRASRSQLEGSHRFVLLLLEAGSSTPASPIHTPASTQHDVCCLTLFMFVLCIIWAVVPCACHCAERDSLHADTRVLPGSTQPAPAAAQGRGGS